MGAVQPRCDEHAGEPWPPRCSECDRLAADATSPVRAKWPRDRARIADDVRAAAARGLVPDAWPRSVPLPEDVQRRLTDLRERDRLSAMVSTGTKSPPGAPRSAEELPERISAPLGLRGPDTGAQRFETSDDPDAGQVTPAIRRFAERAADALYRYDVSGANAALDDYLASLGTDRKALRLPLLRHAPTSAASRRGTTGPTGPRPKETP